MGQPFLRDEAAVEFEVSREQLDWVRRACRRDSDVPLDRDDLMSAAYEALWIAFEARADNLLAYAIEVFLRRCARLYRRASVHRRVFDVFALDAHVHLFRDETSGDPALILMAREQAGRPFSGPPCKLCGTPYGRGREKSPRVPKRIHGLCYHCDQRRRRLDRGLSPPS